MKKIKLFALLLLAGATVFTSCKKDEETGPAPTLTFSNYPAGSYEIDFATLGATTFDLSFVVSVTAEEEISAFTAKKTVGGTTTNLTAPADFSGKTSYSYSYLGTFTETDVYPVSLVFTCTDKADQVTTKTFTVTKKTGTTPNPINTFTGISLTSAYSAPTAAEYVAAITGVTYNHTAAGAASFGFVSGGATNGATIFTKGFDFTLSSVPATWNNQSYVKETNLDAAAFDAITDEDALLAAFPAAFTQTKVNTLQDGAANAGVTVIAFIDGSGKKGFAKLPASMDNTAGQVISISIKVQQ
ncbi:MAG: hypothetical protein CVU05_02400 [Bacteroidetes bacterium HGW-Bacteroidetes-21]|nr:MAG: hypothetical protein CVU05_02400 [Bacteroidetes bacterium HGW-Bacteroidetes-21]